MITTIVVVAFLLVLALFLIPKSSSREIVTGDPVEPEVETVFGPSDDEIRTVFKYDG